MSLAMQWIEEDSNGNPTLSQLIFFDAVTGYTQNYSGSVTKHPIDIGGSVTDHFIRENPVISVSAVITGVDVSVGTDLIRDARGVSPFNTTAAPNTVSVLSTDNSILQRIIPDSIGQWLSSNTIPEVIIDDARTDKTEQVRELLKDLVVGEVYNDKLGVYEPKIRLVKLYEVEGNLLKKTIPEARFGNTSTYGIVLTHVEFKEDENTGDALFCNLTFEQVTFVSLMKEKIPTFLQQSKSKSLGKVDSKPNDPASDESKKADGKKAEAVSFAHEAVESGQSIFDAARKKVMGE